MSNRLELSDDRMNLKIHGPGGRTASLRSRRPEGFNATDLEYALAYQFSPNLERGQVNMVRRFRVGSKAVYLHKGTGPPTWWLPRVKVRRSDVMVGWLRGMVAVSIKPEDA